MLRATSSRETTLEGDEPRDPPPATLIARVEPLTRTRAIRGPFDYRLREDQRDVEVGSLLRVPFGRRRTLGVVVEMADSSELAPERLTEPDAVLPSALPVDLVALARWMAREYCSTVARSLGLVLAPGAADGIAAKRVLVAELTDAGREALAGEMRLNDRQRGLLTQLAAGGPAVAASLGTPALRRLEGRGLVELALATQSRRPAGIDVGRQSASAPALTGSQQRALDEVLAALAQRRGPDDGGGLLLHGVTGSGKTEVYLRAVPATLAAGRGAIVLVPEIALTPQTLARFRARFGDVVAVLHSALSQGERHDEWLRLRSGEARVCVGPRSAVLRPAGRHRADRRRRGARRLLQARGRPALRRPRGRATARAVHGAVLLAGSATPRPESVATLRRLRLPERIDHRGLPPVRVLDMRGSHHPLHPETRKALADVRRAGAKAIVLLNRRGWSNFLSCRACGRVWMCPECDVALVLHRAQGAGRPSSPAITAATASASPTAARRARRWRWRATGRAPSASSTSCARRSATTGFPVFRLDADAAARKDALARTLARFEAAPAGVLVGTQMVAKGHDFAGVSLGVVLDADQTLRFPDFRAEERTFALVTQLAGRAGRGSDVGQRARADACAVGALDRVRLPPRLRRLPRRRARAAVSSCATRRSRR